MAKSILFGWDLLFKFTEQDIEEESDMIVAIIHWYLASHVGFRCLGTGQHVNPFTILFLSNRIFCVYSYVRSFTLKKKKTHTQQRLREDEANDSTETLPDSWNIDKSKYVLRYVHEDRVYILVATVLNETIILHLLVSHRKPSNNAKRELV